MSKRDKYDTALINQFKHRMSVVTLMVGASIDRKEDEHSDRHRLETLLTLRQQLEEWGYYYE